LTVFLGKIHINYTQGGRKV